MVLSGKAKNDLLLLLEQLKLEKAKTKLMADFIKNLPCKGKSTLLVLPKMDKNIIIASKNIPFLETIQAKDLNALDLLSFKYLLMPKEAIKAIKETFLE